LQAVIASSISIQNLGAAHSAVALLEIAGGIVGDLASAGLFKLGLHIGGEAAWVLGLRSNHPNPFPYPFVAVIHAWTHQHRS